MKKQNLTSFFVGFIFAIGLGMAGMTQPHKVIGFLDLFGTWDPSLLFVMIGAIGVHSLGYHFIIKRKSPLWDVQWHLPKQKKITPQLIIGSILFGMGWGLAGYCPGPAVVSLGSGQAGPWIFVIAMLLGMWIYRKLPPLKL